MDTVRGRLTDVPPAWRPRTTSIQDIRCTDAACRKCGRSGNPPGGRRDTTYLPRPGAAQVNPR